MVCRLKPTTGVASGLLAVPGFLLPFLLATALGVWITLKQLKTTGRKSMKKGTKKMKTKLSEIGMSVMTTIWAVGTSFCGSYLLA